MPRNLQSSARITQPVIGAHCVEAPTGPNGQLDRHPLVLHADSALHAQAIKAAFDWAYECGHRDRATTISDALRVD